MPPMTSPRSDAPRLSSKSRAIGSASFQPDVADGSLSRLAHDTCQQGRCASDAASGGPICPRVTSDGTIGDALVVRTNGATGPEYRRKRARDESPLDATAPSVSESRAGVHARAGDLAGHGLIAPGSPMAMMLLLLFRARPAPTVTIYSFESSRKHHWSRVRLATARGSSAARCSCSRLGGFADHRPLVDERAGELDAEQIRVEILQGEGGSLLREEGIADQPYQVAISCHTESWKAIHWASGITTSRRSCPQCPPRLSARAHSPPPALGRQLEVDALLE